MSVPPPSDIGKDLLYFYNLRRHVLHEVDAVGREDESDTNIVMFPNRFFSIHDIITNNLIKKTYLRKTCRGDSYYSLDKCFWQRKVEFNKSLVRIMSWSINLNDWLVYLLCLFCFHQYTKFYYNPNIPLAIYIWMYTFHKQSKYICYKPANGLKIVALILKEHKRQLHLSQ